MVAKLKVKSLSKFTNLLLKKGKKSIANTIVLKTLFLLKKKTKKNPINIISNVIKNLTPGVTTKKTVIAGRLYHLPASITRNKALYFGCKWLQQAAIESKEALRSSLDRKLADECLKVLKKKGQSLIMLKQHNKIVSDNRPFLRFIRRKRTPRLPRKVWLRRKQLLWLKRKKKVRRTYETDIKVTPKGLKTVSLEPISYSFNRKVANKADKLLRLIDKRVLKKVIKKERKRIKLNPNLAITKTKFRINIRKVNKKKIYDKKFKNKAVNKKNKF